MVARANRRNREWKRGIKLVKSEGVFVDYSMNVIISLFFPEN